MNEELTKQEARFAERTLVDLGIIEVSDDKIRLTESAQKEIAYWAARCKKESLEDAIYEGAILTIVRRKGKIAMRELEICGAYLIALLQFIIKDWRQRQQMKGSRREK